MNGPDLKVVPTTTQAEDTRTSLLASIVDSSEDAIIGKTPEGEITSWNRAAESMYGYTAEEIIGKKVNLLLTPERKNEMEEILKKIKSGERMEHYETVRRRKDGTQIHISLTVSPIHDASGKLIGLSSTARDITERKRVAVQLTAASLYARSLIEASVDPLVAISAEGKMTDVNEVTIKVVGVPREKLIGTDFSNYFNEPEKAREVFQQIFTKGFVTDYPLTIRHKNGRLTDVLFTASVYKDEGGNILGVFAAARDVTAQKQAEAEVAVQRTKELERLAELERFQTLTVGRELKMIQLKKEVEELKKKIPSEKPSL